MWICCTCLFALLYPHNRRATHHRLLVSSSLPSLHPPLNLFPTFSGSYLSYVYSCYEYPVFFRSPQRTPTRLRKRSRGRSQDEIVFALPVHRSRRLVRSYRCDLRKRSAFLNLFCTRENKTFQVFGWDFWTFFGGELFGD